MANSAAAEIIAQVRKNDYENENKKGSSSSSLPPKSLSDHLKHINYDQGELEENPLDDQFATDEEDDEIDNQFENDVNDDSNNW